MKNKLLLSIVCFSTAVLCFVLSGTETTEHMKDFFLGTSLISGLASHMLWVKRK